MSSDISGMLVPLEEKVRGRSFAIVVNSAQAEVRQRFTVAHELGHLLLHGYTSPHADRGFKVRFRDSRSSDGSINEEIEANQFAAELLMPRELILRRLQEAGLEYVSDEDDSDGAIADLAREFNVSRQAITFRIANLLA